MTTEEEAIQAAAEPGDKDAISKLLEQVPADGHEPEPKAPDVSDLEPATSTPPEPQNEPSDPIESRTDLAEPEDPPQDDYEREIDDIEAPRGASERTTEVLKILKRKNREEHRARKEREAEIAELGKRKILDDPTEQELNQLRRLRDEQWVEHSPKFQEYDVKVREHEGQAMTLLKQWKLPDETAKYIEESGGLIKFQLSDEPMLLPDGTTAKIDGQPVTKSEWWEKVAESKLSHARKVELADVLSDARRASRDKMAALTKAKSDPTKFIQDQQAEVDLAIKDFQLKADKQAQLEADLYGEIAKPREIPTDAKPELRGEIEAHNARLQNAKQDVIKWINDHTPEAEMSKALSRVYRDWAQERVKELEKNNKDLQTENHDLKSKWEAARKSKELSRQQSTVQQQAEQKPEALRRPKSEDDQNAMKSLLENVPA